MDNVVVLIVVSYHKNEDMVFILLLRSTEELVLFRVRSCSSSVRTAVYSPSPFGAVLLRSAPDVARYTRCPVVVATAVPATP